MKLKMLSLVANKLGRPILKVQEHSPALLFTAGVVGVVTTIVLASRATLKMDAILEEAQDKLEKAKTLEHADYLEEDRQKDIALVYIRTAFSIVKLYAPAVILGVASISALTGAHVVLNRRNAALTAAYTALDRGFREYRSRVVNEVGEEREQQLRFGSRNREIVEDTDEGPVVKTIKSYDPNVFSPYARFFDQLCRDWQKTPEYNLLFLRCQQNYANDLLRSRGHIFLNEVYDMLGLERSKAGAVVGWVLSKTSDNYIDFGIFDGNNPRARDFVNGREGSFLLDFNVDGVIYDLI